MSLRTICLHGPESTGKSTLAAALAARLGAESVPEYGREWCEANGAETRMADLVAIAMEHQHRIAAARARAQADSRRWLVLDTDPVMTAVWAQMLYGEQDPFFEAITAPADLYLVPDIDLGWVDDGLRYLGAPDERQQFLSLSLRELDRRHLPYALVQGKGDARLEAALGAIALQTGEDFLA